MSSGARVVTREGNVDLSFETVKDGEGRRRSDPTQSSAAPADRLQSRKKRAALGSALRSAYQRTVDEEIPPEMLDLLGKLE